MASTFSFLKPRLVGFFASALLCMASAFAHEIPADIRINAFVRPAGDRMEVLIRVPMLALTDVDIPTRGPGYLDLGRIDASLSTAAKLWLIDNIELYENGQRAAAPRIAAARVSLPSDRSFTAYEQARAHVLGPPLPDSLDLYWSQQLLDVLLDYPIQSDRSAFALRLRFDRLAQRVSTALRFLPPGGAVRAFELHGDPGLVPLDPGWREAAQRFVASGFWHILEGADHLLFLLCLVIPVRRLRPLVVIVTAFTVAHSISLFASALGFVPDALWFPPLVETLIAASVLYMALENIFGVALQRRWMLAFAFGLVHGFGFSFALRETLQFAGDHLLAALLAFNLGVEIGQLAVLLVLAPALTFLFSRVVRERLGVMVLSALVAHTAWHWMLERWEQLAKFPFPVLDAAFMAGLMRGGMAVLVLVGLLWLAKAVATNWMQGGERRVAD